MIANDVRSLADLRTFVHTTLCEKEQLLAEQFELTEMELQRRGRRCGMQFCLHGPRSVRLGAVWAEDRNVLYLYDASGRRYARIELPRRLLGPESAAA